MTVEELLLNGRALLAERRSQLAAIDAGDSRMESADGVDLTPELRARTLSSIESLERQIAFLEIQAA